jgi:hypothetical protein
VIICLGLNLIRIRSNGDTFYSDDEYSGCITVGRKQATNWRVTVNVQANGQPQKEKHSNP